jgi:peptide subunit release factor 1 (eRF1)
MGAKRILALLDEYLQDSLKQKIIGRIENAPNAEPRDRKELIENALREHRVIRETKAIEDLRNYKPGEQLVSGLDNVIAVCNQFLVRKLLVSESLEEKGFVCHGHHYVSRAEGDCPVDGVQLVPVENIIDEIVEITRFHGVEVMIVEHAQSLLTKYGGIAALVYASGSQT